MCFSGCIFCSLRLYYKISQVSISEYSQVSGVIFLFRIKELKIIIFQLNNYNLVRIEIRHPLFIGFQNNTRSI